MTRLNVHLYRDSFNTPWGFRLQGGKDLNQPLTIQRVFSNSPAEGELQRGDNILSINGRETADLTHKQAQDYIKHGGGQIQLAIYRPPPGTFVAPLSPPIVTPRPRAPSLQSPGYHSPHHYHPSSVQYNQSPRSPSNNPTMNGYPYQGGYSPSGQHGAHSSKPTYLQIQVNNQHHNQQQHPNSYLSPRQQSNRDYQQHQQQHQHQHQNQYQPPQQYYLSQQQQQQQEQPARYRSSFSQPPVTPTTPPPPWATQQSRPKAVTKLSKLGGGGQSFGTNYTTLPRSTSAHAPVQHRPRPSFEPDEEREPEIQLATGPVPRVCSRRNLGGGGKEFGTAFGRSATLPRRHEAGRRSSQPPSLPSSGNYGGSYYPSKVPAGRYGGSPQYGTDYSPSRGYGQTPAQRYEPFRESGNMLNRVQTTLDNITLSPRTPDAVQPTSPPVYQSYSQPQPPQQQVYTPTSLLLEQQRLQGQQQHQPDEVRTPLSHPKPRVSKPATFSPSNKPYNSFGTDYSNSNRGGPQQSVAVWRPQQQQQRHPYSPGHVAPNLSHSAPPPWKRPDDEVDDSTPAWRSTLKSASGVKPWERDVDFQQQQQQPEDWAPSARPAKPVSYQAGDRDWSQSAVLRFLNQEAKRNAPPVAPKPAAHHQTVAHHSPAHPPAQTHYHQLQQPYYDDAVGASDF